MADEELRILHNQHKHDDSESSSFFTLKLKLKPMKSNHVDDHSELTESYSCIKTYKEFCLQLLDLVGLDFDFHLTRCKFAQ